MKKIVYMMRHGETLFNKQKKIQGWCDAPLTELGIEQAKHAYEFFEKRGITFTNAYSSTSERACDTLEIATNYKMDYKRVKGLKEWNFGAFEGKDELLNPKLPYGDFFKAYGGESEMEVRERVVRTVKEIMDQDGHECVLMVSHGASCAQFYREWEAYAKVERKERLYPCCILKYEYDNGIFACVEINNIHSPNYQG